MNWKNTSKGVKTAKDTDYKMYKQEGSRFWDLYAGAKIIKSGTEQKCKSYAVQHSRTRRVTV